MKIQVMLIIAGIICWIVAQTYWFNKDAPDAELQFYASLIMSQIYCMAAIIIIKIKK